MGGGRGSWRAHQSVLGQFLGVLGVPWGVLVLGCGLESPWGTMGFLGAVQGMFADNILTFLVRREGSVASLKEPVRFV